MSNKSDAGKTLAFVLTVVFVGMWIFWPGLTYGAWCLFPVLVVALIFALAPLANLWNDMR